MLPTRFYYKYRTKTGKICFRCPNYRAKHKDTQWRSKIRLNRTQSQNYPKQIQHFIISTIGNGDSQFIIKHSSPVNCNFTFFEQCHQCQTVAAAFTRFKIRSLININETLRNKKYASLALNNAM